MKINLLPYKIFTIGFVLTLIYGCPPPALQAVIPNIAMAAVTNITANTAVSGGNITDDGGAPVTARGVCWSTSTNPTITDSKTNDGAGAGSFTSTITGLTQNTIYHLRAYATNSKGTGYGSEIIYTTLQASTVTDIDGNLYHTVTIGSQVWMAENLNTTKYRNGDPIPNITDNTAWNALITGAYCNYNNDINNVATYGRLYNWYAVVDARSIVPLGWHIPSDAEWTTLTTFLGGENLAGGKLKEIGTVHWQTPNTDANNSTGFTALPGGIRNINKDGAYAGINTSCDFWSSTAYITTTAWHRSLANSNANMYTIFLDKNIGNSVRCIKDY